MDHASPEQFVPAYDKATGKKMRVPAAWLEQGIFPNLTATPSSLKHSAEMKKAPVESASAPVKSAPVESSKKV